MKISKLLLVSASIFALASCGNNPGTTSQTASTSSSEPVVDFSEVDFETFKAHALNLPASPYNKVSAHYVAKGRSDDLPIDINKTVTLTKKTSRWKIDVDPTHPDYSCANVVKQALDITLSNTISAYEADKDSVNAKFYYSATLGFKMESTGAVQSDVETSQVSSNITWNIYGDSTYNDSNSEIHSFHQTGKNESIHVTIDFTYSTESRPEPSTEEEEIQYLKSSVESLLDLDTMTVTMDMIDSITGSEPEDNETIAVLYDGEYFCKEEYKETTHFNSVTKQNDKNLSISTSGTEFSTFASYVDDNHANDVIKKEYIYNGLLQGIDYLEQSGSFEKLGDYIAASMFRGEEFIGVTKDDYTVSVNKTTEGNERIIVIIVSMKDEWLATHTIMGMPASEIYLDCTFTYDDYLTSYANTSSFTVSYLGQEMNNTSVMSVRFSDEADQETITLVKGVISTVKLPENIENEGGYIKFNVNGYNVYSISTPDYADDAWTAMVINGVINDPESDFRKIVSGLGDAVNIKYYFNGQEIASFAGLRLRSCLNNIDIEITAKDPNKCAVMYLYRTELINTTTGWASITLNYSAEVADRSSAYQIKTTYGGKEYKDSVLFGTLEVNVEGTTYDISESDNAFFTCIRREYYTPDPIKNKSFHLVNIANYDDIKDLECPDGTTIGENLDGYFDTVISFDEDYSFTFYSENRGVLFLGHLEKYQGSDTKFHFYLTNFIKDGLPCPIEPALDYEMNLNAGNQEFVLLFKIATKTGSVFAEMHYSSSYF